jgi:dipeptidase
VRSRNTSDLPVGTIKVYVLVEQLEAVYQLMEIRAALRQHFRRLQHRPLGLHQQRRPTRWRGIRPSSIRTSTPSR